MLLRNRIPTRVGVRTPEATRPKILWQGTASTGNLNELTDFTSGYDGAWLSGAATAAASTTQKKTGTHSYQMNIDVSGGSSGARLAKTQNGVSPPPLLADQYYSCWYWVPQHITVPVWWIVFQWKHAGTELGASDPLYSVNILNRTENAQSKMYLRAYRYVGNDGAYNTTGAQFVDSAPAGINVPVATWFHMEARFKFHRTGGVFTMWQDGVKLWDLQNIVTLYDYGAQPDGRPYQWAPSNYSDALTPTTVITYADELKITDGRWGPVV